MARDYIRTDEPAAGLQRLVARFHGHAYDPHRHETYAIGHTLSGAQAFRYRGDERVSFTGQCMVLHPDEIHDGHAGVPEGFVYRMIYVEPWLLREALGGRNALPFVTEAVAGDAILASLIDDLYAGFPDPVEPLQLDACLAAIADRLIQRSDDARSPRTAPVPSDRIAAARALLTEEYSRAIVSADLEQITGLDRFELARAFRRAVGTSPHRYLVGRRLEAVRTQLSRGENMAEAAVDAGFADQSHMTRHFRARYGMTPGRYARLSRSEEANGNWSGH